MRFYKYLFSYIVLLVFILFIVGSVVYGNFLNVLQAKVHDSNIGIATQIRDQIDLRISEMDRMAVQIASDPMLTISKITGGGYDTFQAARQLRHYKVGNAFVYDVALFFNNDGIQNIYAASGVYEKDVYFNIFYKFERFNKEYLIDIIESVNTPTALPAEGALLNNVTKTGFVTYIYPLPINAVKPYAAVIFLIEEKTFIDMVRNVLKNYDGFIFILDGNNEPIVSISNGYSEYDTKNILKALYMDDNMSMPESINYLDNEQFSVVKLFSDYNSWQFIMGMPTMQFMEEVYQSRKIFNYMVIAALIIGSVMSFGFALANYKPLRKLVDSLKLHNEGQKSINSGNDDEITFISHAIDQVVRENKGLMARMDSKAGMVKEQLLLSLLKGNRIQLEEFSDTAEFSGLKFDGDEYVTLFFLIDDYDDFKEDNDEVMQDLLRFSIINVVEELSLEMGYGYGLDIVNEQGIILIVNINERRDSYKQLEQLCIKTKDFFKQNFHFTMTVGIGNIYNDISMIKNSFIEAKKAANYRFIKGKDQIIFYKNIQVNPNSIYRYPGNLDTNLVTFIKQGKVEEAQNVIRIIINDMISRSLSPEVVQGVCFGILNTVMKTLDELGIGLNDYLNTLIEDLFTSNFETARQLEDSIICIIREMCDFNAEKTDKNIELKESITEYVTKNCYDNNLSLEVIASEFKLSPSYITRFFKEQTGYTLKQYIDRLRLDKSRDLLKNTDLTLSQIVKQIGYGDETNFIRKFKKCEGVTPIQYRNVITGRN